MFVIGARLLPKKKNKFYMDLQIGLRIETAAFFAIALMQMAKKL